MTIQKKLTLSRSSKKICLDESRIWSMKSSWKQNESSTDQSRIFYLTGYLHNKTLWKSMTGISGSTYDFTKMSAEVKTSYLRRLTRHVHYWKPNIKNSDHFYSRLSLSYTVLIHVLNSSYLVYGQDTETFRSKILS